MDSRFVLVPISSVSGKQSPTQDFHLSSTDLFHSPAGTIKLSLFLNAKTPTNPIPTAFADSPPHSSATAQLVLDKNASEDYSRIEFPDVSVVDKNQQMVSEYFAKNRAPARPWRRSPTAPSSISGLRRRHWRTMRWPTTSQTSTRLPRYLPTGTLWIPWRKGVAPPPKTSEEEIERRRRSA